MSFRTKVNVKLKPSKVVSIVPTASSTLAALMQEDFADVLVIGVDKSGRPSISASFTDELKAARLIEKARSWLMQMGDAA